MGGLWTGSWPLLLASTSTTRLALLRAAGIPADTEASGVDERALERSVGPGSPSGLAQRLADAKALAVCARRPGRLVLGADQVLSLEGELLSKAADAEAAAHALARLSGRVHELFSAYALARDGALVATGCEAARLTMRALDAMSIRRYVALAGDAATRSVGAYEIEGLGAHLFSRIEGEHTTILGLPMLRLLGDLRRLGLLGL